MPLPPSWDRGDASAVARHCLEWQHQVPCEHALERRRELSAHPLAVGAAGRPGAFEALRRRPRTAGTSELTISAEKGHGGGIATRRPGAIVAAGRRGPEIRGCTAAGRPNEAAAIGLFSGDLRRLMMLGGVSTAPAIVRKRCCILVAVANGKGLRWTRSVLATKKCCGALRGRPFTDAGQAKPCPFVCAHTSENLSRRMVRTMIC
jgi:hypothetical protein